MMMDDDVDAGDAAVHCVLRNAASHCSLEAEAGSYAVVLHARRTENGRHISVVCLGFFSSVVMMFIWFCSRGLHGDEILVPSPPVPTHFKSIPTRPHANYFPSPSVPADLLVSL